jgi:OOP family OmpA-OmpF porin
MKKFIISTAILAASTSAFAAHNNNNNSGFYLDGSLGVSHTSIDKSSFDAALTSLGATNLSSSVSENDVGFKLQAGYQVNSYLAVEGGYVNLGKFKYNATFSGVSSTVSFEPSGWNLDVLGIMPINNQFSVFVKAGMIRAKVEDTVSATNGSSSASEIVTATNWKPNYGVGVTYTLSRNSAVRAELEQYRKLGDDATTGSGDVNLLSIGYQYKF